MLFKPAQLGLAHLDSAELEADKKACKKIGPCGVGTKAQQALAAQREELKIEHKKVSKEQRETERQRRFNLNRQKRKEKHKGR